ncbi:MAG: SurA N-terminal domain-containing protein [Sulfurimonas sp.]|jgi:peptidyl-prolyl cis-trans isomerase D|nr:SurA N-terminal domain-containing protein [Sulfurimonas sp.]
MITWMQRHKKYLIITIWISTIAFVGAGFVGWGQYSYGDKAGAVAKVGNVEVTMGELQKTYSNLYAQYNKMFQGNFDEEKAKSFGLQSQALKQLTEQALIINLALSYDLEINDTELLNELKTQEYFFKDGAFDKEIYKQILSRNNMSIKEYETDVKKQLLIQKALKLLPVDVSKNELGIINTILNIADRINYKILSDEKINIDTSDAALKPYWESKQQEFMSEVSYEVKFVKQERVSNKYDEAKVNEHYLANKTHFKDVEGKLLPLEGARVSVINELDTKATKDAALRQYIAYKKAKLASDVEVSTAIISASNNPYNAQTLEKISKLSITSPFLKPILVNDIYYTFELTKVNPSKAKSFEEAKKDILVMFVQEQKKSKLLELAKNSVATFTGDTTDFITNADAAKLTNMDIANANEFLIALFSSQEKRGFISLKNGNVVLYNILEQKLLNKTNTNPNNPIVGLKSAMFNEGLIKNLQNKYKTEIFIEGL